jgi:hypothetical protein
MKPSRARKPQSKLDISFGRLHPSTLYFFYLVQPREAGPPVPTGRLRLSYDMGS